MGLIEEWQEAANRASNCEHPSLGVVAAYDQCATELTDASTPRPPKAEWFGDGPSQWPSWWIRGFVGEGIYRGCYMRGDFMHRKIPVPSGQMAVMAIGVFNMHLCECVPVAREGFPSPVGWGVVGG